MWTIDWPNDQLAKNTDVTLSRVYLGGGGLMSIDLPDDEEFQAWLRELPNLPEDVEAWFRDHDDDADVPVLPPSRRVEQKRYDATRGVGSDLDLDLEQLENAIAYAEFRRMVTPDIPAYMFDRFEAITTMRGGMGLVIKARDPQLDRLVAIKLWMRASDEAQDDLIAEAKTLAKLKHENVVTVYELGVWNRRVFFVMEWVEGADGHKWLKRTRSWREVRRVFVAAGTGLVAAHDAGIHHRDFKPSNMLIGGDGRVVVADFGLAASLHTSPGREGSGGPAGTPVYMAPERLRGKRGDARADQFSFCAAMWQALYQQRPFEGATGGELSAAIERGELREAPDVDVPAWLVAVVRKGLAFDPADRHRDMRSLIAALLDEPPGEAMVGGDGGNDDLAVVDGRVLNKDSTGSSPRERWHYGVTGFLAALVVVLGLHALMGSGPPKPALVAEATVEPYHAMLGAVADDDYSEAGNLWQTHRKALSDAQALRVARECLGRAEILRPVDRTKAYEAVDLANRIGREIERFGSTPEAQKAGGQLAAEKSTWFADHPPSSID